MGDRRRPRKVQADDVAPADRDALTARAECVSGVAWGDRVSSIHQAREGVTTAGVRSGRRAGRSAERHRRATAARVRADRPRNAVGDRKSTRLNSSHGYISYAVFCLKKKKNYVIIDVV